MSVLSRTLPGMRRCTRFRRDGTKCTHTTEHIDGWCRRIDCPGFVRPDPSKAPETFGSPRGTAKHIRDSSVGSMDLGVDEVPDVHVTVRAIDSFRFHHGGDQRSAVVQLRAMLEDFLLRSASAISANGFVRLSRQGYDLVLSPDRSAVTGYATVHRERTWEQVKSKVPSRFRRGPSELSDPPPEPGPPVSLARFADAFDVGRLHLTGRVKRSFAKLSGMIDYSDEELRVALISCAARFVDGSVTQREDGLFEAEEAGRIWLVTEDCRTLVGVKALRARDPAVSTPAR